MDDHGKHLKPPSKPTFGRLNRPAPKTSPKMPLDGPPQRKRAAAIALAVLGVGTFGLLAAASASRTCRSDDPAQPDACNRPRSGGTSGYSGGGYASSNTSTSKSTTGIVARGGFGRTGFGFMGRAAG